MISKKINRLHRYLFIYFRHYSGNFLINKQQLLIYIYGTAGSLFLLLFNLTGLSGPQNGYYFIANSIHFVLLCATFFCFLRKTIPLQTALVLFLCICQLFCLMEMLYTTFSPPTHTALIIGNMILLITIQFLSIICSLRWLIWVSTLTSLCTYTVCCFATGNEVLPYTYILFLTTFLFIGFMGHHLTTQLFAVNQENQNLKQIKKKVVSLFHIDKKHIREYISQAHTQGLSEEQAEAYLKLLLEKQGAQSQCNIERNISTWHEQTTINYRDIDKIFPELTASEHKIVALILKGYKLKEICELLGKKESNVCCQRSNIRGKLHISSGHNLRKILLQRALQYCPDIRQHPSD